MKKIINAHAIIALNEPHAQLIAPFIVPPYISPTPLQPKPLIRDQLTVLNVEILRIEPFIRWQAWVKISGARECARGEAGDATFEGAEKALGSL
jgi:hypothetical protein